MREEIESHYIELALIGLGLTTLNELQMEDLNVFINATLSLLDGFSDALDEEEFSEAYLTWRSGIYAHARHVFVRYTLPDDIFFYLPEFPGISCLGDGACGCHLEWEETDEGVAVYWIINPAKESCAVCIDLSISWQPYIVEF
jgi:hypothetical protein